MTASYESSREFRLVPESLPTGHKQSNRDGSNGDTMDKFKPVTVKTKLAWFCETGSRKDVSTLPTCVCVVNSNLTWNDT